MFPAEPARISCLTRFFDWREIPNIAGVKEASGDISQIGEICTRAPARFRVLSGDDSLTLPVIALGGHGIISVASNEAPGMMSKFAAACLDGRWEEARDWNRKLYPLMKINFVESSPIPVKAALSMMGKISGSIPASAGQNLRRSAN